EAPTGSPAMATAADAPVGSWATRAPAAADPASTVPWTWGQPPPPSPWATSGTVGQTQPLPATAAPPVAAAAPAAARYPSARWPLVLLGLVSLLCVLGLVPLGMVMFRQMRLPATTPRVAPSTGLLPRVADPAHSLALLVTCETFLVASPWSSRDDAP